MLKVNVLNMYALFVCVLDELSDDEDRTLTSSTSDVHQMPGSSRSAADAAQANPDDSQVPENEDQADEDVQLSGTAVLQVPPLRRLSDGTNK